MLARHGYLTKRLLFLDEPPSPVEMIRLSDKEVLRPCSSKTYWQGDLLRLGPENYVAVGVLTGLFTELVRKLRVSRVEEKGKYATITPAQRLIEMLDQGQQERFAASLDRVADFRKSNAFGEALRLGKVDPDRIFRPELEGLWRVLRDLMLGREPQWMLCAVATDNEVAFELRRPRPIPIKGTRGAILLDATAMISHEELRAANPRSVRSPAAYHVAARRPELLVRMHIDSGDLTRRKLVPHRQVSSCAIPKLKNVLRIVVEQYRRVGDGILDPPSVDLITYKTLAEDLDADRSQLGDLQPFLARVGYYGRDDRGTNRFEGTRALLTFGDPFPNLGSCQLDAEVLGLEAEAVLDSRAAAVVHQAHGRARPLRTERPLIIAHAGRLLPPGWSDYKYHRLPVGRPVHPLKEPLRRLWRGRLEAGQVTGPVVLQALVDGRLSAAGGMAETAYNESPLVGSYCHEAPSDRTQRAWVKEFSEEISASPWNIKLEDRPVRLFARKLPEAEVRRQAQEIVVRIEQTDGSLLQDEQQLSLSTEMERTSEPWDWEEAADIGFGLRRQSPAGDQAAEDS